MLWLLFLLLGVVILVIFLALPVQAALGYLAVIVWIGLMLYIIFYQKERVSESVSLFSSRTVIRVRRKSSRKRTAVSKGRTER